MPMLLWVAGMEVYQDKDGEKGKVKGCPKPVCIEIMERCPTDSGQLSLDPASGLPPPPPALWLLSEAWQPRSYFRFRNGAHFLP